MKEWHTGSQRPETDRSKLQTKKPTFNFNKDYTYFYPDYVPGQAALDLYDDATCAIRATSTRPRPVMPTG